METIMQPVACAICLHDVPVSEANSAEARDYITYFFGLDCYTVWREQQEEQPDAGTAS
jgi:hypothetical protein